MTLSNPMKPLRTLYLMVLTVRLGGTFVLEQPRNSNMEFYPMFVEFLRLLYQPLRRTAVLILSGFPAERVTRPYAIMHVSIFLG